MSPSPAENERAFILGCQRSGTTLLRFLLGVHPEVCIVDESAAYPVLAGRKALASTIANSPDTRQTIYKIPRFSEQLQEQDIRDEVYGQLAQFYRDDPCIFVVRDPRDVVASMCTLKASAKQSWVAEYGRPMIEHRASQRPAFSERYGDYVHALQQRGWPEHLVAALYWLVKNESIDSYLAAELPVLLTSYERLVADPGPHLQVACQHLGIGWDDRMLRHEEAEHGQLDSAGLAIGASDPKRAIDSASVGRYQDSLQGGALDEVNAWTSERFEQIRGLIQCS